jgi:DNA-binding GntR family transcriptional regulator
MPSPQQQCSESLSEATYQRLRNDIIHGVIRPNERLIEVELAERLSVSRTPIRESLQRLAAEGLIVGRRQGWVVYEFTANEIREIYEARSALEGYAARLAAIRATDEQLEEIRDILRESQNYLASPRNSMIDVNDRLHDAIIAASGNRRIATIIMRNRAYSFNYQLASSYTEEELISSRVEHERVVAALLARNPQDAEEAIRTHIEHALEIVLRKLL